VTRVTVITDAERHVKMMLLDDHLLCDAALVDFELTLSCPRDLTAFVGVDSLTHAIESYVSSKANPATEDWSLRAAALIGAHLRRAWSDPGDREARAAMALGATLAGMAFSNASVALVHGMSRPIGAHFGVPHGLSNAVLLPEVTRWSLGGAPERYARIAEVLGVDDLVGALQQLNDDLEIPRLAALAERDDIDRVAPEMAEAALESGSPGFNPRVPDTDEIVALYRAAYEA
jgi:alcohol dehydrogenase class IV